MSHKITLWHAKHNRLFTAKLVSKYSNAFKGNNLSLTIAVINSIWLAGSHIFWPFIGGKKKTLPDRLIAPLN